MQPITVPMDWMDHKHSVMNPSSYTTLERKLRGQKRTASSLALPEYKRERGPYSSYARYRPPSVSSSFGYRGSRTRLSGSMSQTMLARRRKQQSALKRAQWRRSFPARVQRALLFSMSPKATWCNTLSGRLTALANQQSMTIISQLNYTDDLASMWSALQSIFAPGNPGKTTSFQVSSWAQRFDFHNQTNTHVYLDFYECTARYDIPFVASMTPTTLISQSFADTQVGGGTLLNTSLYASPFWAARLTTAYRLRKRTMMLEAGGQDSITFYATPFTCHYARYRDTSNNAQLVGERGRYKFVLAVLRGSPANDAATVTNVGSAVSAVNFLAVEKVMVGWNQFQNYKTYNYTNAVVGSSATPTIMSEASGTGQAVAVV